jgi:hypothetical protein
MVPPALPILDPGSLDADDSDVVVCLDDSSALVGDSVPPAVDGSVTLVPVAVGSATVPPAQDGSPAVAPVSGGSVPVPRVVVRLAYGSADVVPVGEDSLDNSDPVADTPAIVADVEPQLVCPTLRHPQVAPLMSGAWQPNARLELRMATMRTWYQLRVLRSRAGGINVAALQRWIDDGFPDGVDIVVDEPAERKLWSAWGALMWYSLLAIERDELMILGLPHLLSLHRFQGEAAWGVPPSPYGVPVWLPRSVQYLHPAPS